MRIAVLAKQITAPSHFRMAGGRVVRRGVPLETNAYCRRANAKALELAGDDGEVVVFTMGPPSAEDTLREMIAAGASRGVHVCDPALAGSDTLATARALAAALRLEGPFDLVLAGLNSLDADTGQVPPEIAELLGLPFAAGVRSLEVHDGPGGSFTARLETDHGFRVVTGRLPVMLSAAERLTYPSKAPPEQRAAVAAELISRLAAADLGVAPDHLGTAGSPTSVGPVRVLKPTRNPVRAASVPQAVDLLVELGAFSDGASSAAVNSAGSATVGSAAGGSAQGDSVSAGSATAGSAAGGSVRNETCRPEPSGGHELWCFFTGADIGVELLGEAAKLARAMSDEGAPATVTAVTTETGLASFGDSGIGDAGQRHALARLGAAGADRLLVIPAAVPGQPAEPAELADALAAAAAAELPWALLTEGTRSGRVVASVVAARCGWGLTGDAVGIEIGGDGRLVAWKPAFGGQVEAPIWSRSPVQMATIRPGVLARRPPRPGAPSPEMQMLAAPEPARVRTVSVERDDSDVGELRRAAAIVALGQGVDPAGYPVIDELCAALGGAALGGTRKVTDKAWLPRNRQIGVTGHAVAPKLLVAVGSSGRFNHTVGIRNAGVILAVNSNPSAEIFDQVDVGIVGPWEQVVPRLTAELNARALIVAPPT